MTVFLKTAGIAYRKEAMPFLRPLGAHHPYVNVLHFCILWA